MFMSIPDVVNLMLFGDFCYGYGCHCLLIVVIYFYLLFQFVIPHMYIAIHMLTNYAYGCKLFLCKKNLTTNVVLVKKICMHNLILLLSGYELFVVNFLPLLSQLRIIFVRFIHLLSGSQNMHHIVSVSLPYWCFCKFPEHVSYCF